MNQLILFTRTCRLVYLVMYQLRPSITCLLLTVLVTQMTHQNCSKDFFLYFPILFLHYSDKPFQIYDRKKKIYNLPIYLYIQTSPIITLVTKVLYFLLVVWPYMYKLINSFYGCILEMQISLNQI